MAKRIKLDVRYDIVSKKGKPKKLSKQSAIYAKKTMCKLFGGSLSDNTKI